MIRVDLHNDHIPFEMKGSDDLINAELAVALAVWRKILVKKHGKKFGKEMYEQVIAKGYRNPDVDELAELIAKQNKIK